MHGPSGGSGGSVVALVLGEWWHLWLTGRALARHTASSATLVDGKHFTRSPRRRVRREPRDRHSVQNL